MYLFSIIPRGNIRNATFTVVTHKYPLLSRIYDLFQITGIAIFKCDTITVSRTDLGYRTVAETVFFRAETVIQL